MPCVNGVGSRCSSLNSTASRRSCTSSRQAIGACKEKRKRSHADSNGNCFCGGNRQRDRFQHAAEMWNKGCNNNPHALRARLDAYSTQQRIANGKEPCCPPPVPLLCHIRCIARQKGVCGHKDGCCPCCCPTIRCPCNDCCIREEPQPLDPKVAKGTTGDLEPQVSFVQAPLGNQGQSYGTDTQPASAAASQQQLPPSVPSARPPLPRPPPLETSRPPSKSPSTVFSSSKRTPSKTSPAPSVARSRSNKSTTSTSKKPEQKSSSYDSKPGRGPSSVTKSLSKTGSASSSGSKRKAPDTKATSSKENANYNDRSATTSKVDLKDTGTDAGSVAGKSTASSAKAKNKEPKRKKMKG